ncbi:MAG: DUF116 domain-containing protein [Candidatus Undinarchaeales archaeon]
MNAIYLLGTIALSLIAVAVVSISLLSVLTIISLKTDKIIFPHLIILLISAFESPAQAILSFFKLESDAVTQLEVNIRNKLNLTAFKKTKYKNRLLLLPQCLRHATKCPAKTTKRGIRCAKCGRCKVKNIVEKAEDLGYKYSIAPGGTFASRRIKEVKPDAVLGVGCLFELKEGLNNCAKYRIPAIGVQLEKTGCVNTKVDLKELFETMELKEN